VFFYIVNMHENPHSPVRSLCVRTGAKEVRWVLRVIPAHRVAAKSLPRMDTVASRNIVYASSSENRASVLMHVLENWER
jgi:hypothetical protein